MSFQIFPHTKGAIVGFMCSVDLALNQTARLPHRVGQSTVRALRCARHAPGIPFSGAPRPLSLRSPADPRHPDRCPRADLRGPSREPWRPDNQPAACAAWRIGTTPPTASSTSKTNHADPFPSETANRANTANGVFAVEPPIVPNFLRTNPAQSAGFKT